MDKIKNIVFLYDAYQRVKREKICEVLETNVGQIALIPRDNGSIEIFISETKGCIEIKSVINGNIERVDREKDEHYERDVVVYGGPGMQTFPKTYWHKING